jgi:hypothetical protein
VYLLNPTDYDKQIFTIRGTKINYTTDINFIDFCDCWFYDITPKIWGDVPKVLERLKTFKGKLFCINYEDGYSFFEWLLPPEIKEKTLMFINNAMYLDKNKYEKMIQRKLFLTTAYITNSQYVRWENFPIPVKDRKKRIYFSGALTGFPSILTNYNKDEFKLRYTLTNFIKENGIDNIIRFTGCDPDLKYLYDEMPIDIKSSPINHGIYTKELTESLISLSIKGNSFPTNRFYESQAAGCITFTNPPHVEVEFFGTGISGKDYIEINVDGSDLKDKFNFYCNNDEESQKISISGYKNWEKYTKLDSNKVWPTTTFQYHVAGIKDIANIDITKL